ncbi:hypothetical protein [Streptomyces scabiei]|uniref:hypothetical protein n=1 Tax=Streptomyces scabiei TaxID=1930 RepID=UPI0037A7321B
MSAEIWINDKVRHWSHPGEIGNVIRVEHPRTGSAVVYVAWPGSDVLVPYAAHHSLRKIEGDA